MSAQSKAARAANKAKAHRLASEKAGKVDASDYTIPTDLHAEAKTGLRPVSRRNFKRGGVVAAGDKAEARADRKPRASGGDAKIMSELGMKAQRLAQLKKQMANVNPNVTSKGDWGDMRAERSRLEADLADGYRNTRVTRASGGKSDANAYVNRNAKDANEERDGVKHTGGLKAGGRTHKMDGGDLGAMVDPRAMAALKMKAADRAAVQPNRFGFTGVKPGVMASAAGLKKGGHVEGSAADKAEDKTLAKKHGMTMAQWEKSAADKKHDRPKRASGGKSDDQFPAERGDDKPPMPLRDGSGSDRNGPSKPVIDLSGKLGKYAKGGAAHPASCKCKECGGRVERASGGRTKAGKTNVNIIIATGQKPQGADAMPPSMGGGRPPGMPVAVPPPAGAGAAPAPMPMPIPMPMPAAGGAPMPRKAGGRTYRSYKDMDAGALSGQGRLEKSEIQAHKR